MNLFFVRISVERKREDRQPRTPIRLPRVIAVAAGAVGLVATMVVLPASAATTGSNSSTVGLLPPAVRSINVSPATAQFGNCVDNTGAASSDPTELPFPNGSCQVGTVGTIVTGGITITNGPVAGHVYVNGQNATPADAGTPWTMEPAANVATTLPGVDQFAEETLGSNSFTDTTNEQVFDTTPVCDLGFTQVGVPATSSCAATANELSTEALAIDGPSSSTDTNGPFTITTTWSAVP
jgi:hypothetical protein